jgi:hypothetical protein
MRWLSGLLVAAVAGYAPADEAEDRAAAAIVKLGGIVTRDSDDPKKPVFYAQLWGKQVIQGMVFVKDLPNLMRLELRGPHVTLFLEKTKEAAEQVGNALIADLNSFTKGQAMADDITAVCFSRMY